MKLSCLTSTFVVKRLINVIRHVDDWKGAVFLTTVHELYIAVMWVFSTVQYKFAVYENQSLSDMLKMFSHICENYEEIMRESSRNIKD